MKVSIRLAKNSFILFLMCLIFVVSCKREDDPDDNVQQQNPKALLNYRVNIAESVLDLTDVSIVFEDNAGNVETEIITSDMMQEDFTDLLLYIKEYRFDDFPASFNCRVSCTPKIDIDPYEFCTLDENGEWIINGTWGLGLGYAYYIDSVLVDIEGFQNYPAGKKLDQLDDLCDDIDGKFLEIHIDENGEIIVTNILGHKFVDLGLPSGLKWAAYNVGAQSPEEYGDYFAWGEVNPKSAYTEENCSTIDLFVNDFSGYWDYDAARANWGGTWRMPTEEEMIELVLNTHAERTQINGVYGSIITGSNGNSIFFPCAGKMIDTILTNEGEYGYYYSSTSTGTPSSGYAPCYYFVDRTQGTGHNRYKYHGFTIRAVSN